MVETLIRGVEVFDGSGTPPFMADVAITGDRISCVGAASGVQAQRVIEGQGLALAPGFIDVHTHDDTNVIRQPDCLAKISQGVTTVVVGNCGISAASATLNGPPPEPMNLLGRETDFCYPSFSSYAQAIESARPAVNVAALVGHTTLRNNVMDDLLRPATVEEIDQMRKALSCAMAEGALGLSSGLAYAPARQANIDEVIALAQVVSEFGGIYTTHMRDEADEILSAIDEALTTGQKAEVPIVISHLKCAGAGNWGRTKDVLKMLDNASRNQSVSCDCYPYTASSTILDLRQVSEEIDIFITWSEGKPEHARKLLKTIAKETNLPLLEAARALQPAGAVYHCMDEQDVRRVLSHQLTAIGSDGLPNDPHPHPRLWGTFPRVLGHYCRDERVMPLTKGVHKMTGYSASRFGLTGRGLITEGAYADLVLFDPITIRDTATYEQPFAAAEGIEAVFVNGMLAYQSGGASEQRAGRFLRRG